MNKIIRQSFNEEFHGCINGYISTIEYIFSHYDVVVFMARKAVCFYHALLSEGILSEDSLYDDEQEVIVVSSRCLSSGMTELFQDKRIALIDDVVVEGRTLVSTCEWFAKNNMKPDVFVAACCSDFIASQMEKLGNEFPLGSTLFEGRQINELALQIIRFIGKSTTPYNIDHPVYRIQFSDIEDVEALFEQCNCQDISSSYQQKSGIGNYVLNINVNWFNKSFKFLEGAKYAKIRFLWRKNETSVIAVPIVLFKEMDCEQLVLASKSLLRESSFTLESLKNNLDYRTYCFGLVQYGAAKLVYEAFQKQFSLDKCQCINEFELFGKEHRWYSLTHDYASVSPIEFSFAVYDSFIFNECINSAYDAVFSRNVLVNNYTDSNGNKVDGSLVIEDFEHSCKERMHSLSQEVDEYALSNTIDVFVDKGILVPLNLYSESGILRGYKCGEVTKINEENLRLFAGMLYSYQTYTQSIYLDRIEFEKLCVLFFKDCYENNITTAGDEDDSDSYDICFTRFGARVASAKNPKYGVDYDTSFANRLLDDLGIKELPNPEYIQRNHGSMSTDGIKGSNKKYSASDVGGTWWHDFAADKKREYQVTCAVAFATNMAGLRSYYPKGKDDLETLKENHQYRTGFKPFRYLNTFNDFLVMYATGPDIKNKILSLVAEINLFVKTRDSSANNIKAIAHQVLRDKNAIESGMWKFCCYTYSDGAPSSRNSKSDLVMDTIRALTTIGGTGVSLTADYMKIYNKFAKDENPALVSFLHNCGKFIFRVAYTIQAIGEKYSLSYVPKNSKGNLGRVFDARWYYLDKKNDDALLTQLRELVSNLDEERLMKYVLELYREGIALVEKCDVLLQSGTYDGKHFQSVIALKTDNSRKSFRRLPQKIEVKFSKKVTSSFQFFETQTDTQIADLEELLGRVSAIPEIKYCKVIVADMKRWYEGLYGSKKMAKSALFELILDRIQQIQEPLGNAVVIVWTQNQDFDLGNWSERFVARLHSKAEIVRGYYAYQYVIDNVIRATPIPNNVGGQIITTQVNIGKVEVNGAAEKNVSQNEITKEINEMNIDNKGANIHIQNNLEDVNDFNFNLTSNSWNDIIESATELLNDPELSTEEKDTIREAVDAAKNKDEKKFVEVLKKILSIGGHIAESLLGSVLYMKLKEWGVPI